MIHRVYVRSNMNSPFVVQDYDRLESSHNNTNIFSCSSETSSLPRRGALLVATYVCETIYSCIVFG